MGRVILCAGKKAEKPYLLKTSGVNIYTVEELCYCLKDQLDVLDESVIDRDMAIFLAKELGLKERGELLEQLVLTKADLRSRLVVIFCSCDYFDEQEIEQILSELELLTGMSDAERRKRRADRYLKDGFDKEAVREYRAIIASKDSGTLSPEEYGNILHNLGVVDARNGLFDKASVNFREAFERNGSDESLKSYLLTLKLARRDDEYNTEAMRLLDSASFIADIEDEVISINEKIEQSDELTDVERLKVLAEQGRMSEYERLSGEIISGLKRNYRMALKE